MPHVHYFAYGSNMSRRRLQQRIAAAEQLGVARLERHRLAFHKSSEADGSAKCDIVPAPADTVLGVLFRLPADALAILDAIEGYGYRRARLRVHADGADAVVAQSYMATVTDPALRPYTWYKQHVLAGAREAGLPEAYIARIEAVAAVVDPDPRREARELAIYR